MELLVTRRADKLVLGLKGELDHHGAKGVMREIDAHLDTAVPMDLTLDFGGVTFMDSSGIAVILRAHRRMQEAGGCMTVTHLSTQAKKGLDAAGVGRIVTIKEEKP